MLAYTHTHRRTRERVRMPPPAPPSFWASPHLTPPFPPRRLLGANIGIQLITMCLAGCSVVSGYFGMNLDNGVCGPDGCVSGVADHGHNTFVIVCSVTTALMFLMGQTMKKSQGKANPGMVGELALENGEPLFFDVRHLRLFGLPDPGAGLHPGKLRCRVAVKMGV